MDGIDDEAIDVFGLISRRPWLSGSTTLSGSRNGQGVRLPGASRASKSATIRALNRLLRTASAYGGAPAAQRRSRRGRHRVVAGV